MHYTLQNTDSAAGAYFRQQVVDHWQIRESSPQAGQVDLAPLRNLLADSEQNWRQLPSETNEVFCCACREFYILIKILSLCLSSWVHGRIKSRCYRSEERRVGK